MSEALIDIVAVSDQPGVSRWEAMAPRGFVAGVASLRPIIPFGHDFCCLRPQRWWAPPS